MHGWLTVFALVPALACQRAPASLHSTAAPVSEAASAVAPERPEAPAQPPAPAAAAKPVPLDLPAVVARVNGEAIERSEFERAVENLEARAGGRIPPERRDEIFRGLLDQLIAYHLLAQESRARQLAVNAADVDAELKRLGSQFPNEAAFQQALAARQVTLERLRTEIERDLLVGKLLETEVGATVKVTDADIRTFYDQNQDRFREPESMRASHILIRIDAGADEAARQRARQRAAAVLEQARRGADFAALAREHSEDPGTAAAGGDLGFFARGQMVPAFETAAFALKPGELSGLVESPFGLHIIKAGEHRPARTLPLAEVSDEIRTYLAQQQRQEKLGAYIERLKARAKIEILF